MLIKATLSNARHPEYGEVTIPFPIKTSEYDHTIQTITVLEVLWSCFCVISGNFVFSAIIGEVSELFAVPTEG